MKRHDRHDNENDDKNDDKLTFVPQSKHFLFSSTALSFLKTLSCSAPTCECREDV